MCWRLSTRKPRVEKIRSETSRELTGSEYDNMTEGKV
jgi:hypothetical protein